MEKETVHNEQTSKRRQIKLYLIVGIIILVIGVTLLSMKLLKGEGLEQSGKLQQSAETQQTSDPKQLEVSQQVAEPVSFRKFDELTVAITEYEMFYRGNASFYSNDWVEYSSLFETLDKYALFHYLEQHGYRWDDETRARAREWIQNEFDYDKKNNPELYSYYQKMFETLQITEEDYIDHYLVVNKEYNRLVDDLANNRIGLDIEGEYNADDELLAYSKLVGLSEELVELEENLPEPPTPMEPQPELPFITEDSIVKVTTNAEGEYIFVETLHLPIRLGEVHGDLLWELKREVVNEELNRYSLERYQEAAASYKSDDPNKMKTAKEVVQILEILESSVEMELY